MQNNYSCLLLVLSLFWIQSLSAQVTIDSNSRIEILTNLLKVNVDLVSGLQCEQRINKTSTIIIGGGVCFARQSDDLYRTKAPLIFLPDTYAEYRNYYNIEKRTKAGKDIRNNSADFIFGKAETFYAIKNQNYFGLLFIQGWGLQRSMGKKISIDAHLGIIEHIYYDKPPKGGFNYIKLEPDFEFSICYIFN